jgi:hypothetical protein
MTETTRLQLNHFTRDLLLVTLFTLITALLIEFLYHGFISSILDLNILVLLFVAALIGNATAQPANPWTRTQKVLAGIFFAIDLFLLLRFVSLQVTLNLLGLALVLIVVGGVFVGGISIYDNRSHG